MAQRRRPKWGLSQIGLLVLCHPKFTCVTRTLSARRPSCRRRATNLSAAHRPPKPRLLDVLCGRYNCKAFVQEGDSFSAHRLSPACWREYNGARTLETFSQRAIYRALLKPTNRQGA